MFKCKICIHHKSSVIVRCVCVPADLCSASHRGYPAGQVCRGCAAGCASCGKNATHCLSCEEPLLLHKHQCVEECPPAHAVRDRECQRCPSACQECHPLGQCTGTETQCKQNKSKFSWSLFRVGCLLFLATLATWPQVHHFHPT